jgi:hypothetical protein
MEAGVYIYTILLVKVIKLRGHKPRYSGERFSPSLECRQIRNCSVIHTLVRTHIPPAFPPGIQIGLRFTARPEGFLHGLTVWL